VFRQLRKIWEDPEKAAPYREILDSYSSVVEDSSLLRCFAVSTGKQFPTFRRIVVYSGSSSPKKS